MLKLLTKILVINMFIMFAINAYALNLSDLKPACVSCVTKPVLGPVSSYHHISGSINDIRKRDNAINRWVRTTFGPVSGSINDIRKRDDAINRWVK